MHMARFYNKNLKNKTDENKRKYTTKFLCLTTKNAKERILE